MNFHQPLDCAAFLPIAPEVKHTPADTILASAKMTADLMEGNRRVQEALRAAAQPCINVRTVASEVLLGHGSALGGVLEQVREMAELSNRWQREIASSVEALRQQFSPVFTGITAILEAQRAPYVPAPSPLGQLVADFCKVNTGIAKALNDLLQPRQDLFAGLASLSIGPLATFEPLCRFLLARSWCLSADVPASLMFALDDLFAEDAEAELDEKLCAYFRARLDQIEVELIAGYPHQQPILSAALDAHRAGQFALSVPVLLTVADAIAHELWQTPFFSRKSISKVKNLLGSTVSPSDEPWLLPLFEPGSLRADTRTLPATSVMLNRHDVIHGLRVGWDTELDSLKCVALLDYLHSSAWLFPSIQVSTTP